MEVCNTNIERKKKELKNSVKKVGKFKVFFNKVKNIFKFNKKKALPVPEDGKK